MSEVYRILGAEISPYSVKVRSYCRYKKIPHEWVVRDAAHMEEFQRHAKLPLIPLLITPDGESIQDSTPIVETLEARFPEPSIHPEDPALAFLSALIEEFGDEWGNKWMFHYRWAREADQLSAGKRIAAMLAPGAAGEQLDQVAAGMIERMVSRTYFVGSNERTGPQIEESFREAMGLLDTHLVDRPYLFGGRPSFGDFGLWGQIYNAWTDPTCNEILSDRASQVVAWVKRMLDPSSEGDFESWDALAATLMPLLDRQIGRLFLPWSDANATAISAGGEAFTCELGGRSWDQKPQKYHARSLQQLRDRYRAVSDKSQLDPILAEADCLEWLQVD